MNESYNNEFVSNSTTVTKKLLNHCFIRKQITNEHIHFKAFQVDSDSHSFIVTFYQPNLQLHHEDLNGHLIKTILYPTEDREIQVEDTIPNEYLVSQETCFEHVMIILSGMYLSYSIQERLVRYISTESVTFKNRGLRGGLKVEIDVEVNLENWIRIDCRCNQNVNRLLFPAMECSVCLAELSSKVSRMELPCSHVFHRDCIMKWLEHKPSCPVCRTVPFGEIVSIY